MLGQFLVNRNMIKQDSPIQAEPSSVQIFYLPEMVSTGAYPAPIPFGRMGKPVNPDGYSDHYPITMTITEAD